MEAVEGKNAAAMDSLLADDYVGYGPSVGDSVNKKEAIANWKDNVENLYESIKYTRHQNMAVTIKEGEQAEAGDWVSNWAYLTIKFKDGRGPVNVWVNATYKIENGKIARSRSFYNEADVLRQLGYSLTPPGSGE
jgi:ketosteroid isomerase-like protein